MTMTDREIALLSELQEDFMPELVNILRQNATSDGFGGHNKNDPDLILTNVPARVTQAQTQALGGEAARDIEVEFWTVRLPLGTAILENDYIDWGSIRIQADEVKSRTWETVITVSGKVVK